MTDTYTPPPLPPPFTSSTDAPVLLAQGAEGRLYKAHFLFPSIPAALKFRPTKPYRHPILDRKLTRQRILQEARCLVKLLREGVPVPGVLSVDWNFDARNGGSENAGAWLLMEWIDGPVVRQVVGRWEKWVKYQEKIGGGGNGDEIKRAETEICAFLRRIGRIMGLLHKAGVIHGDLTTSNLMLKKGVGYTPIEDASASTAPEKPDLNGEIVLIDFGLASQSVQSEDRAVDLYVLERAFGSSHPRTEAFFEEIINGYETSFKGASTVLTVLKKVRMRGRKRSMIG